MVCYVIHDNGKPGQKGFTEYSAEEMREKFGGSVDKLLEEYTEHGTTVYSIEFAGVELCGN